MSCLFLPLLSPEVALSAVSASFRHWFQELCEVTYRCVTQCQHRSDNYTLHWVSCEYRDLFVSALLALATENGLCLFRHLNLREGKEVKGLAREGRQVLTPVRRLQSYVIC